MKTDESADRASRPKRSGFWAWRIARIAGIDVYIHLTFLIIVGWIGMSFWVASGTVLAAVEGVAFILAIFGCVVLHEMGHALAARRYGISTRDITLYPIGGVARLERMPERPQQEFVVAIAGPLVNVAIAVVIAGVLWLTGQVVAPQAVSMTEGSFLSRLMMVNVALVVFNMLPAFPMDGGRVLRALLATRIDYTTATKIAASVGQSMAIMFCHHGTIDESVSDPDRTVCLVGRRARSQLSAHEAGDRRVDGEKRDDHTLSDSEGRQHLAGCDQSYLVRRPERLPRYFRPATHWLAAAVRSSQGAIQPQPQHAGRGNDDA